MVNLDTLLNDLITPDAVRHRVKYFERYQEKEEVWFWSDPKRGLENYIHSLIHDMKMGDNHFMALNPDIAKIKATYDAIAELKDNLINLGGFMTYDQNFTPYVISENQGTLSVIKNNLNNQNYWSLSSTIAETNHWCWERMQQVYSNNRIFKLTSKYGSEFTFDSNDEDALPVHCIFFKTKDTDHSKYFHTLSEFSSVLNLFFAGNPIGCIYSPPSASATPEEIFSNDGKQNKKNNNVAPWRFLKYLETGENRLTRMWKRMGGAHFEIDNMNPDNLYFFSDERSLEFKKEVIDCVKNNPWKHCSRHSIYRPETVKELKS